MAFLFSGETVASNESSSDSDDPDNYRCTSPGPLALPEPEPPPARSDPPAAKRSKVLVRNTSNLSNCSGAGKKFPCFKSCRTKYMSGKHVSDTSRLVSVFTRPEDFADWPQKLFDRSVNVDRRRIESALEMGAVVHSMFTGRAAPETAMRMLSKCWGKNGMRLPSDWLQVWSVCGCDQTLLRLYQQGNLGVHCFGGVLEMLPPKDQREIISLRPPLIKKGNKNVVDLQKCDAATAASAFAAMDEYLQNNRSGIFKDMYRASPCKYHPGEACMPTFANSHDCEEGRQPLNMLFMGPMCTPFTEFGKMERMADANTESLFFARNMMCSGLLDLSFIENSWNVPVDIIQRKATSSGQRFIHVMFGPEDGGWAAMRTRLYGACLANESLLWVGPENGEDIQKAFLNFFRAAPQCSATVFAGLDTYDNAMNTREMLAQRQGCYNADVSDIGALLPNGQGETLDFYQKLASAEGKEPFVADISQDPKKNFKRYGQAMPTLATSSELVSFNKDIFGFKEHFFTAGELGFSQGWPTIDSGPGKSGYTECMALKMSDLSLGQQRKFRGNSMHLYAMAAWFQFVCSNIIRRDRIAILYPPLLMDLEQQLEPEPEAVEETDKQ